jgi:hypothetical protein
MPLNIQDYDNVTLDEISTYPEWMQKEIEKSMRDSMPPSPDGVMNVFEFTDNILERWQSGSSDNHSSPSEPEC